jgi:hypothetical protein
VLTLKKLLSSCACIVVAFMAYAMIGAPTPSEAAGLRVSPTVVRAPRVVWIQVDLPETTARSVRIDILTPKVNGARQRWQYCEMEFVGLGTYRCGLHVGSKTPARSMTGEWLGKLSIDRDRVGSVKFQTR